MSASGALRSSSFPEHTNNNNNNNKHQHQTQIKFVYTAKDSN